MPELPEVETVVRDLRAAGLPGCAIDRAHVHWPRTIEGMAPARFRAAVRGRRIEAVSRRAKFIVLTLSGGKTLLVHLRMTGRLLFAPAGAPRAVHEHVVLALDDGRELRFQDSRKFGRWTLLDDPAERLGALGPEPLSDAFTPAACARLLGAHARMLKPLLLDQRVIAGLGNIYVDEALWDARLHPCRSSRDLTRAEAVRLRTAIRRVLRRGVRAMGTTLGAGTTNFYSVAGRRGRNQDGLRVFRRAGEPCPRCATPIARLVVAQRSTHICPTCQTTAGAGISS